jgi:hypothetical protein
MVQIHRFRVPALAPGHLHKTNFNVPVPKAASGTYDVIVCADVLSQVAKFSEKRECRKAGRVTIGHPSSGVKGYGPTTSEPSSPSPPLGGSSPPAGPGPAPASGQPDTALDSGPTGIVGQSSATFAFHGSDANDTFQCSLDGAPWATCVSPQQYTSLADGTHTFQVHAVNGAGEPDATPAEASWTVDTTPPAVTLASPANGGWTNNVMPMFSGAAGTAPGDSSTITVYLYAGAAVLGSPIQTLTTNAVGTAWSVATSSALAQGTYTAQVEQNDAARNLGKSALSTFTVDTTAPAVTVSQPTSGSTTGNNRPSFSGTAGTVPGDSPKVTVNVYAGSSISGSPVDTLTGTATSGSWSVAPAGALPDGTYTVQATQSDAPGNVGNSAPSTFTIDTVPPAVTLSTPVNESVTTSQKPTFTGTAGTASGDSATVRVDIYSGLAVSGTPVQTLITTATAGSWSVSASTALTNGTYTAQAHQLDTAGNAGTSAANTFTVNAVVPSVTLTAPANGTAMNSSIPTFTGAAGTASGDSSTVTVELYLGSSASGVPAQTLTTTQAGGHWSTVPVSALPDGTYTAQATQSNTAGNTGASAPSTFRIDTIAPAITLTVPSPGAATNNNKPALSGAAGTEPGDASKITLTIYAGSLASGTPVQILTSTPSNGHWTTSPTTALADGTYTAAATQSDASGNVGTSAAVTFTVDTAPPITTIDSAPSGKVATGSAEINFSSNEPNGTFQCSLDAATPSTCTSPLKTGNLAAGPHTFTVRATDMAGNTDPSPPTAKWDSVAQESDLCGPILHNQTLSPEYASVYVLTCSVSIEPGVKLNVGPGTIIKAEGSATIFVQGVLEAAGTTEHPVTLTSWRDDSVGGDTNNDGSATLSAAGDWGGIQASPAGGGNPLPTVKLDHTKLSYAGAAISVSGASTSITNNIIEKVTGQGITVSQPVGIPVVTGNTVNNAGAEAIVIYSASLDMGLLSGNSGSGNGLNGVQLGADTVTVSSSLPWAGSLVPVLYGGCGALTVAPKVTLTLGAGTIIKGRANCGDELNVQGSLVATGAAASPVMFTSWRDDSVGGDTNGDGNATLPAAGDWGGISSSPAGSGNPSPTVNLDHVVIDYASSAVTDNQAVTSITSSTVRHANGTGIYISSPEGVPTVKNNTITNVANEAIVIYSASLDMGLLSGNSGSGNGLNGVQLGADTVTVSSSLPWAGSLVPVLYGGCGALTVAPKVTLTLGAGTIIKGRANCGDELNVEGTLDAIGTAEHPVIFTSWRDDSVWGDTNGDGNATLPAAGDWGGIRTSPAGSGNPNPTVNLDHVAVKYGSTAISANQATTSITNSTIEKAAGQGISVTSPVGVPAVKGNTVTGAGQEAIVVYGASLDMGALTGNSGSGNGLNGVQLGSDTVTVSSALPWTGSLAPVLYGGCGALTVAPKVTLTLGAGTIIKGRANCGNELDVQGTLEATGTSEHPVTLTSWRDDAIGGDTNGDGNATLPTAGDWGGIQASPGGNGNPNPTLKLDHVVIDYASNPLSAVQSTTSITNSTISHATGTGIYVASPEGVPTVTGNTITNVANEAIVIYSASLDMGLLTGNSGSGSGLNGVQLGADTVTVSSSLPWTGSLVPVLYGGCGALTVAPKVTLTLGAGTIIKGRVNCGDELNVQGSVVAVGTAALPVTFTSWRDDSVGGDTNGDGNATLPAAGDWGGIQASPAGNGNPSPTVNLDHVVVKYGATAISANQATTAITNSTIEKGTGQGISVTSPEGVPTVKGNTVTHVANEAIVVYSASLDMGALTGNSGSGNGLNGVQLGSDAVTVSSALPWTGNLVPVLYGGCAALTVAPKVTLTLGAGTIIKGRNYCGGEISVQGTLEANGTTEQSVTLTSWQDDSVGGDTNGDGNATLPAAGDWGGIDTNPAGGGNPSPTLNLNHVVIKYATTAVSANQATTSITNSTIEQVTGTGIALSGVGQAWLTGDSVTDAAIGVALNSSTATYRGRLTNDTTGAQAYSDSSLDARETDWGDPAGPPPYGNGSPTVGNGVTFVPWIGYTPPPPITPPPGGWQPSPPSCASVLFIGVRGSGESPSGNNALNPAAYPGDLLGGYGPEVRMILDGTVRSGGGTKNLAEGFEQELGNDGVQPTAVQTEALIYEADSTNDITEAPSLVKVAGVPVGIHIDSNRLFRYYDSVRGGIDELEIELLEDISRCPSERIVLAGYSQGALVIHDALISLQAFDPSMISPSHIGAVLLLADPHRISGAEGLALGTSSFGEGLYAWLPGITDPDIPAQLSGVTANYCNEDDFVCDFHGISSLINHSVDVEIHSSYMRTDEFGLADMGRWAADRLIANGLPHS